MRNIGAMTDAVPVPSEVRPHAKVGLLPPYAAGRPPVAVPGLTPFKLSSNENPHAPVPAVLERIHEVVTGAEGAASPVCRYPDPLSTALRERLAAHLEVPADDVVTGAGSLGALSQLITAFAGDGGESGAPDEVVFAWRSFEAYPIVVRSAGAKDVQVPLTADHRHDLPAMLEAITDRTRVVLLCTPNNPTGPVLTTDEVEDFLGRVPPHVLVVIDEAYVEFVRHPQAVSGLDMYRRHANVVVLRTFSKAHGLANLRVGYSVSRPEITAALRTVAVPFAVSTVAEQAAIASLDHLDDVLAGVQTVVDERERVVAALAEAGWDVPETHANFVWLPLGERAAEFAAAAGEKALSVRAFAGEGVRVSIGEREANDRFLEVARAFGV